MLHYYCTRLCFKKISLFHGPPFPPASIPPLSPKSENGIVISMYKQDAQGNSFFVNPKTTEIKIRKSREQPWMREFPFPLVRS